MNLHIRVKFYILVIDAVGPLVMSLRFGSSLIVKIVTSCYLFISFNGQRCAIWGMNFTKAIFYCNAVANKLILFWVLYEIH